MTQTFSLATAEYVLQVSDRLVTRAKVGASALTHVPFDPDANKNIIFRARDGIVAISFSGNAFIRGVPTDRWIAERLYGSALCAAPQMLPLIVRRSLA
jgi:hypothetical protein